MGQKKIQIKYCGGCNPGYERVEMVASVMALFKDLYAFPLGEEQECNIMLYVNGCPRACAENNSKNPEVPFYSIIGASGFKNLVEWLTALHDKDC